MALAAYNCGPGTMAMERGKKPMPTLTNCQKKNSKLPCKNKTIL